MKVYTGESNQRIMRTRFLLVILCLLIKGWAKKDSSPPLSSSTWHLPGGRSFADVLKNGALNADTQQQSKDTTRPSTTIIKQKGITPPFYAKLPRGAKTYQVRNVYDGDTFTLINDQRVRLLGVDTPELKEKQPFAEQAKDFTKKYCHKRQVWLVLSKRADKRKDRYGRWLAQVYVQEGDAYLNVNEGLVAAGLAFVYSPTLEDRPDNWYTLLDLQKRARTSQLGLWNDLVVDKIVYKTKNGSAYHLKSCPHLSHARHWTALTASQAADMGLHPCRTCLE